MKKLSVFLLFVAMVSLNLAQVQFTGSLSGAGGVIPSGLPFCFAAYGGNDTSSGQFVNLPKADVMACYDALPSTGGAITAMDAGNTHPVPLCKATDPSNCGIYIMGTGDLNYTTVQTPPAITGSSWSGGSETMTVATGTYVAGMEIQTSGSSPSGCNTGGWIETTGGGSGTVTFPLVSNPGSCTGGTLALGSWRLSKGRVTIEGIAGSTAPSFVTQWRTTVSGGGSGATNSVMHPMLWLSGVVSHTIKNIYFYGAYQPANLGVDSVLNYADFSAVPADSNLFEQDTFQPVAAAGAGPAVRIEAISDYNHFNYCQFFGNAYEAAKSFACTRTSGLSTCTGAVAYLPNASVVLPSTWTTTIQGSIFGVSDYTFDGNNTFTITSTTSFTFSQPGLPDVASPTSGGVISSDLAAGMTIDAGSSSEDGSGFVYVEYPFLSYGGIRAYQQGGATAVVLKEANQESEIMPQLEVVGCPNTDAPSYNENQIQADINAASPGTWTDASPSCRYAPTIVNGWYWGPGNAVGAATPSPWGRSGTYSGVTPAPELTGAYGVIGGRVIGQQDTARRLFGAVASRYVNLAGTLPPLNHGSQLATADSTTSPDPSGGTNAASYYSTPGNSKVGFYSASATVAQGDHYIAAAFVRSRNSNGLLSPPFVLNLLATANFVNPAGGTNPSCQPTNPTTGGSGEWQWVYELCTIATGGTTTLSFYGKFSATIAEDFAFPLLIYIPAADMTPSEAAVYAANIATYRNDAAIGTISILPNHNFQSDTFSGPATAPTGACSTNGQWVFSQDGHATVCFNGTWSSKI